MIPFRSAVKLHRVRTDVESLPPIPLGVLGVVHIGCDENASIADMIGACSGQTTLTRAIVREANAGAVSASDITGSLAAAVEHLGRSRTMMAALGSVLAGTMDQSLDGYGLARHEMWRHSLISAHIADVVRTQSSYSISRALPVAALVHDIGIVLMHGHLQGQMSSRLRRGRSISVSMERGIFGLDHAELGSEIVTHWGLSDDIADAVQFHHSPLECPTNLALGVLVSDEIGTLIMGGDDTNMSDGFFAAVDLLGLDFVDLLGEARVHLRDLGILGR